MPKVIVTPLRQQAGEYGIALPHQPLSVGAGLAAKLVETGNWVEGLSEVAKAKEAAAKKSAKAKAKAVADTAEKG